MQVAVLDDYHRQMEPQPAWETLRAHPAIEAIRFFTSPLRGAALFQAVAEAEIVVALRERTRFTAEVLEGLPRLRFIAQTGNHAAHIDLAAATRRGVAVGLWRQGPSGPNSTAELTMGLILALVRGIARYHALLQQGGWTIPYGEVLAGKTLGVIGLGRVGAEVSRLGRAFGMEVLAWSPHLTPERAQRAGAQAVDLDTLLQRSHIVTVHVPLQPDTHHLLDAQRLDRLRPGAWVVNTARGPLIDEEALVARLRDGRIRGAALDVFDREPLPPEHPLRHLPNVVLTPHAGWPTDATYAAFAEAAVRLIEEFLRQDPRHLLNPEVWEDRR
ncbi:MAG: D-2-hydroxyacid dehydrogenase family protein [Firmicutes bacterium]|nr:D-2-hydroxyacid dehydrogenase family protein [Alicyclobacillaceae bacterium]MCL6497860.1 D-2-hydroxyacid dehydrogenase family protein [Bacillota bacterium]